MDDRTVLGKSSADEAQCTSEIHFENRVKQQKIALNIVSESCLTDRYRVCGFSMRKRKFQPSCVPVIMLNKFIINYKIMKFYIDDA